MEIQIWKIGRIKPYERNARVIPDSAVAKVATSIREYGWRQPIVVDSDGVIIAGHTRLLAAGKLGLLEVPVHVAAGLSPDQIKAYRLMDNRSHEDSKWNLDLLVEELDSLKLNLDDLSFTGFDPSELDRMLIKPNEDEDAVPGIPDKPVTVSGDLWICGEHRVLCGDSTSAEAVARLLGDRKPMLLVTDPPYGIELDSEWRDRAGLNTAPGQKRTALSKAAAKDNPQYPSEPSYMKHRTDGHTETTISGDTRADWSEAFGLVPSLMRRPILNHTTPGELVYEPFLGSGTTLAAAELTGRLCCGIELDPKYVDVVVKRWQNISGKTAILDGDGRTFDQVREERKDAKA